MREPCVRKVEAGVQHAIDWSMQPADNWREKAALDPEGLRPYLWCHDPVVHLIFDKSHASELGESVAGW